MQFSKNIRELVVSDGRCRILRDKLACLSMYSASDTRASARDDDAKHRHMHSRQSTVGLRGLEPPTSRLSGVRSNHLSYKPIIRHPPALPYRLQHSTIGRLGLNHRVRDGNGCAPQTH